MSSQNGDENHESTVNITNGTTPRDSKGWDGKLRIVKEDPDSQGLASASDTDNEEEVERSPNPPIATSATTNTSSQYTGFPTTDVPGDTINADEDLLEEYPTNTSEIDLNHKRVSSVAALNLQRFTEVLRLCLRQNQISSIEFPGEWRSSSTLHELDLYDNNIAHVRGLETLTELTSLDLSFNNIKHVKRVDHLKKLKELYLVQNKITRIDGLAGLTTLENLELGANRIREIENLDTLTGLKELWLGKNKITELKNLSPLRNLTLLSIQSNRVTSTSLTHLSCLPALTDLYLSHNALTTLEPLRTCSTTLRILDISSNPITSLSGLSALTNLEDLWASNCQLESFEELTSELGGMKGLETVYFEGNPMEKRQRALYRNKVKLALPDIRQIDATFVRVD